MQTHLMQFEETSLHTKDFVFFRVVSLLSAARSCPAPPANNGPPVGHPGLCGAPRAGAAHRPLDPATPGVHDGPRPELCLVAPFLVPTT